MCGMNGCRDKCHDACTAGCGGNGCKEYCYNYCTGGCGYDSSCSAAGPNQKIKRGFWPLLI